LASASNFFFPATIAVVWPAFFASSNTVGTRG